MTEPRDEPPLDVTLLPQAHRTIRLLGVAEGPFPGALVTSPDGPAVRIDAEGLAGWAGWKYAGAQHIAAPLDVVRRADGHDVLLPWCTERVEAHVDRAIRGRGGLSPGEASTVVVSMLRALAELGPGPAAETHGTWWLTDRGRPVIVLGAGQGAATTVVAIVDRLRAECVDKALERVLERLRDRIRVAAAQNRVPRRLLEEGESDVLGIATPRPLTAAAEERAETVVGPGATGSLRRVRDEPATRALLRGRRMREPQVGSGHRGRAVNPLLVLRGQLVDRVGTVIRARERGQRRREDRGGTAPRRTRVLLVAGACAAAVLLAGLLWPNGGDGPAAGSSEKGASASARPSEVDPRPEASASPRASSTTQTARPGADDPMDALPSLVAQIVECRDRDDVVCAAAVAAGSSGITAVVGDGIGAEGAVLVDRYGDIAVLEVPSPPESSESGESAAGSAAAMIVVLVRTDEKWLVRDAYRVADQPK